MVFDYGLQTKLCIKTLKDLVRCVVWQMEGLQETHSPGHRKAGSNDFGQGGLGLDNASSS